jgi:hypothetical protein
LDYSPDEQQQQMCFAPGAQSVSLPPATEDDQVCEQPPAAAPPTQPTSVAPGGNNDLLNPLAPACVDPNASLGSPPDGEPNQSQAPIPIPPELANSVDLVQLSITELQVRASGIARVLPQVSPADQALLQQELNDINGELDGRSHTDNVNTHVTETISNASPGNEAWNGTYGFDSKFHTYANQSTQTVVATINIHTDGSADNQKAWKQAVEAKWSNQVGMDVNPADGQEGPPQHYSVRVVCNFVDDPKAADYEVKANSPGTTEGGRSGIGGTTSMTGWGTNDTTDVTHEFGHMLGNPEEYFTTNGHDYTAGGTKQGFRDPGAGVMNNPSGPAQEANYDSIRQSAARAIGVDESRCVIR